MITFIPAPVLAELSQLLQPGRIVYHADLLTTVRQSPGFDQTRAWLSPFSERTQRQQLSTALKRAGFAIYSKCRNGSVRTWMVPA